MTTATRRTTGPVAAVLAAVLLAGCGLVDDIVAVRPVAPDTTTAPEERAPAPADPLFPAAQQRWWTWAATEGPASNPVVDPRGDQCDRNQPGDVWFLAGTLGGYAKRRCTVPPGRPLLAPLINLFSDDPADCDYFLAVGSGSASMDGLALTPIRVDGEPVTFSARPGNAVTEDSGRYSATACGLWVLVPPPGPGQHRLVIEGASGDLQVRVDYLLDVQAAV